MREVIVRGETRGNLANEDERGKMVIKFGF